VELCLLFVSARARARFDNEGATSLSSDCQHRFHRRGLKKKRHRCLAKWFGRGGAAPAKRFRGRPPCGPGRVRQRSAQALLNSIAAEQDTLAASLTKAGEHMQRLQASNPHTRLANVAKRTQGRKRRSSGSSTFRAARRRPRGWAPGQHCARRPPRPRGPYCARRVKQTITSKPNNINTYNKAIQPNIRQQHMCSPGFAI